MILVVSDGRAGRACLSETAGSPATIASLGRMLLPLATVLRPTGCSYVLGPAVSERRALPARPPDRHLMLTTMRQLPDTGYFREVPAGLIFFYLQRRVRSR